MLFKFLTPVIAAPLAAVLLNMATPQAAQAANEERNGAFGYQGRWADNTERDYCRDRGRDGFGFRRDFFRGRSETCRQVRGDRWRDDRRGRHGDRFDDRFDHRFGRRFDRRHDRWHERWDEDRDRRRARRDRTQNWWEDKWRDHWERWDGRASQRRNTHPHGHEHHPHRH